jgi:hypothetical protein
MRTFAFSLAALVLAGLAAASAGASSRQHTPTALEFGQDFVATSNAFAAANGRPERLTKPDCVQAAPGRYMCSYGVARPGRALECHVMQARWRPAGPSTIVITLAGRAARCETLRAALQSLR